MKFIYKAISLIFSFLIIFSTYNTAVADDDALIHFFYFNADMPNNTPLEEYAAWYSFDAEGNIEFQSALEGYPFTEEDPQWRLASMERRNRPTAINYQALGNNNQPYDAGDMRAMQVRNPFSVDDRENTLIFHVPSTGFENLYFRFAAKDEGGAEGLIIDYSISSDEPEWITTDLPNSEFELNDEYELFTVDLSGITSVSDNEDLKIRIRFEDGEEDEEGTERVTFNNFSLTGSPLQEASVFYSSASGSLADLETWGKNQDGTGAQPESFSDNLQTFIIQNRSEITLDENWQVSGELSRVVLGNGIDSVSLTLPFAASLTGLIDVSEFATLDMETQFLPVFGEIGSHSTIIYRQTAGEIAVVPGDYHHLILENASKYFNNQGVSVHGDFIANDVILRSNLTDNRALVTLSGNLNFTDVTFHPTIQQRLDLLFTGEKDQNISVTSSDSELHIYNFQTEKSAGSLELENGTSIRTENHFEMHLDGDAQFSDNGSTIFVNNSLSLGGETDSYNLTGTFWMTGDDDGNNQNIRGNPDNNDIPIAAELHNLIISGVQSQVRFRPDSGTEDIVIKGDLVVHQSAEGEIRFYDNHIYLGGNFTFEPSNTSAVSIRPSNYKIFVNGDEDQIFNAPGFTDAFSNVTLQKNGGSLQLASNMMVNDSLHLISGNIETQDFEVVLPDTVSITGGGEDSFIAGKLHRHFMGEISNESVLSFPVGTNNYQPFTLTSPDFPNPVSIRVEAFNGPTMGTAGSGLEKLNDDVYWFAEATAGANFINETRVVLPFENPEELSRIVRSKSADGSYNPVGGNIVDEQSISSQAISQLGYFTLATAEPETYSLRFTVQNEDEEVIENASVTLNETSQETDENGITIFTDLLPNLYTYSVSADGLETESGSVELAGEDKDVTITLNPLRYTVIFSIRDTEDDAIAGAEIIIDSDTLTTSVSGLASIRLVPDTYEYMVSADNKESVTQSLTVSEEDKDVILVMEEKKYRILFDIRLDENMIDTAKLVIAGDTIPVYFARPASYEVNQGEAEVLLVNGTYDYEVIAENYEPFTDSFTVEGEPKTVLVELVSVSHFENDVPEEFALRQNYPNPFNPTTIISYQLPENTDVRLEVTDMLGRRVALLVDQHMSSGFHQVQFDASQLSSGMYFYRIIAGDFVKTQKMMLVK